MNLFLKKKKKKHLPSTQKMFPEHMKSICNFMMYILLNKILSDFVDMYTHNGSI